MKRVIKFRAWVERDSKMFDVTTVTFSGSGIRSIATFQPVSKLDTSYSKTTNRVLAGHFELMQSTGLLDKNGVEIYEGDIIEYFREKPESGIFYPDRRKRRVVEWEEYNRCVGYNLRPVIKEDGGYWEVIGNIYENEDLL